MRIAALGVWSLLSFAGTLALLLYEPDAAFAIIPAILVLTIVTPFVRLDATPWTVTPPLAALALWSGSAPGFYVHGLLGASVCAAVYGVVMLVRFGALSRRRPVTTPARRAWLASLVLGLLVAFVFRHRSLRATSRISLSGRACRCRPRWDNMTTPSC